MGNGVVVIMDFDRTIIDDDSDRWVINQMGLTPIFTQLRASSSIPSWTSLMNRMLMELHSGGFTTHQISRCLQSAFLHPSILSAINSAHSLGCDLRIISDANMFYIETILKHHGVFDCFSNVYTNPTSLDHNGLLHISPFHDSALPPHHCRLCPSNMCKGLVLDRIRGSLPGKNSRFIYVGDGSGDYCPTLKLEAGDFVMPRKNYPLWDKIFSDPKLVHAQVHQWSNGEELESTLMTLINKGGSASF